jgi:hypothetical protein
MRTEPRSFSPLALAAAAKRDSEAVQAALSAQLALTTVVAPV